jgi:transposase InsO family protein/transposase
MSRNDYPPATKEEQRLQAVLALFTGQTVTQVSAQYGISRSSLFDYKRRALAAMRETLKDKRHGPRRPGNRLPVEKEQSVRSVCERHPTLSSYQVKEQLGGEAPTPRTIQRVRQRLSLPRLKKRLPSSTKACRFTQEEKQTMRERVKEKMYLGPYRLAWDIQNRDRLMVSPSTIKRVKTSILEEMNPKPPKPIWKFYERKHPHSLWHGDFLEKVALTRGGKTAYQFTLLDDYSRAYVYCGLFTDADEVNVVRAIIAAMRKYQTIPKALLFDNGRCFRGNLITAFCQHLGIKLIHTSIQHPQRNGKLERAFRDDMREFYQQFDVWRLWELQQHLPEYVYYRNHVRGHWALGGRPAITRLREQGFFALPSVLKKLETFARAPVGLRVVRRGGYMLLLGQEIYMGLQYDKQTICLTDTLDGLEIRVPDGKVFLLAKYRKFCKPTYPTPPRLQLFGRRKLAPMTEDERRVFYEEGRTTEAGSPVIAVAQ